MKKIIAIILSIVTVLSGMQAFAKDSESLLITTIKVNVAENRVTLNDEPLEVSQAPYINENGDTMIDLKALVEALGAEFKEEGGVFTVSINGIDFNYTLNSKDVTLAGQTISMTSEVVKTDSGAAFAPLRFVAETLGADVTYDSETGDIVIVSSGDMDETADYNLLFKYSGKTKIGNSEENWRFTKTENFDMQKSNYSSDYQFAMGDIVFALSIADKDEGISLRKLYIAIQEENYYYKEVMFAKGEGTHNGVPYVYTKHRSLDTITERYAYEANDRFYLIEIERGYENFATAKEDPDVETVLNSLEFNYFGGDEENTVDLAKEDFPSGDDEEKKTEYTDGNFSWKINLDGVWEVEEYYGFYNRVTISRPTTIEDDSDDYMSSLYGYEPTIEISTFSNVKNQTAAQLAEEDSNYIKNTANLELCEISPVYDITIGNVPAKYYTIKHKGEDATITKTYFLNYGEYRFEIVLSYKQEEENDPDFLKGAEAIINSFVPTEINKAEIGDVLEADNFLDLLNVDAQFDGEKFKISYPCEWIVSETENGLSMVEYDLGIDEYLGALGFLSPGMNLLASISDELGIRVSKESLTYYADDMTLKTYTAKEYMNKSVAYLLNSSGSYVNISMPGQIEEGTLMGIKGYRVDIEVSAEGQTMYQTIYYLPCDNEHVYVVTKNCMDTYKNTIYEDALNRSLNSLQCK